MRSLVVAALVAAVFLVVLPGVASADGPGALAALESVAGQCDANQAGVSVGEADAAKAFAAQVVEAEKVCRGRCTYEDSPNTTFTTPCSAAPACDCQDTVNGFPLFQFSCGMVATGPVQQH